MSDREEIEATIPHRDPFLFVDRILEGDDASIVTEWTVPPDASWFRGHYPGNPVTPGVILSEHVFQSAALLIARRRGTDAAEAVEGGVPVLTKIEGARFRRIVLPGAKLTTRVRVTETLGPAYYMSGRILEGNERVADLRFVVSQSGALQRLSESMG